jgi:hypothetical protein
MIVTPSPIRRALGQFRLVGMKGSMAVGQSFQLIKHGRQVPRHTDLIVLGPLHSTLNLKGWGKRDRMA